MQPGSVDTIIGMSPTIWKDRGLEAGEGHPHGLSTKGEQRMNPLDFLNQIVSDTVDTATDIVETSIGLNDSDSSESSEDDSDED